MTERQAWESGQRHTERLAAEADLVRTLRAGTAHGGGWRRRVAAATRSLALRLARFADALDGRHRSVAS